MSNNNTDLNKKYTKYSGLGLAITSCVTGIVGIILNVVNIIFSIFATIAVTGNGDTTPLLTLTTVLTALAVVCTVISLLMAIFAIITFAKAKKTGIVPTATLVISIFGLFLGVCACVFSIILVTMTVPLFIK